MQLGLSALFSSVLNWKTPSPKKHRPACRGRRLLGEQLETRYALAGDVVTIEIPLLPDDQTIVPAEVLPPPADPTTEPVEPPGGINAAPVISDFTFACLENWITIQGFVSDDQDPTGYTVTISGVLNVQLIVGADDWFIYTFEADPEFSGTIFSQTQDVYGLFSNIAFITV